VTFPYHLMNTTVTVYRRTALVLDATEAAASLTVSRQPSRAALLDVSVSGGTSNTGTVTVTGTVEGVAGVSEVLTFDGVGTSRRGAKLFSAISAISTSGLADETTKPTVSISAIGRDGTKIHASYALATGVPAILDHETRRWPTAPMTEQAGSGTLLLDWSEVWSPREGDLVVDGMGCDWIVLGRPRERGNLRPSHWELDLQVWEGTR
jgi:hypothetical protein